MEPLASFLSSPLPNALLSTHPNAMLTPGWHPPIELQPWWEWAGAVDTSQSDDRRDAKWTTIAEFYKRAAAGLAGTEGERWQATCMNTLLTELYGS
jgi:hypothetical protein